MSVRASDRERLRRSVYEGPHAWLWFVGIARIAVLLLAVVGNYFFGTGFRGLENFLLALYGFALGTSLFSLFTLKQRRAIPALLTWTQTLVDFSAVAATVSFTGGSTSFFTFLFVVVILEAGLLQGLAQGFVFATLATLFMGVQTGAVFTGPIHLTLDQWVEVLYSFLIQGLAFYLSAFVSGRWNQRITRLEQFQRKILDNMKSGFLMVDPHGIVTVMNRMGHQTLSLNDGEAIGRPVEEALRVEAGNECPVLTVLRTRRDFVSYEFQALVGDNETRLIGLTTSQLYTARGRLDGVMAAFTDLTEVARMREELQRQDRLAVVGELAAGLAHEVRNPVAAIRGSVDELRANLSSPVLAERLADIAIRESDHLNDIVTGFLDFARNPVMRREVFDVREIAEEVVESLRRDSAPENLRVEINVPDTACPVKGDPSQIRRVFLNLGKNGIEATDGEGVVSITVIPSFNSFEIRFDDQGPGIPPDKITRIFEPFYTEKERGVGMGLAICVRIVTAHDGTIRAAPRAGGGATLAVRLPAAQEED